MQPACILISILMHAYWHACMWCSRSSVGKIRVFSFSLHRRSYECIYVYKLYLSERSRLISFVVCETWAWSSLAIRKLSWSVRKPTMGKAQGYSKYIVLLLSPSLSTLPSVKSLIHQHAYTASKSVRSISATVRTRVSRMYKMFKYAVGCSIASYTCTYVSSMQVLTTSIHMPDYTFLIESLEML